MVRGKKISTYIQDCFVQLINIYRIIDIKPILTPLHAYSPELTIICQCVRKSYYLFNTDWKSKSVLTNHGMKASSVSRRNIKYAMRLMVVIKTNVYVNSKSDVLSYGLHTFNCIAWARSTKR